MKDQLIFDTTNASTVLDSDSVGAFVRSSDGTLITKHSKGLNFASVVFDTVTFTADNAGSAGNSIALVFNNSDTLTTVVGAWNSANPTNTVSFTGQAGTYVPAAGTAQLVGGSDSQGLDVFLLNPSIEVTATNLDIRDLAFATDSVDVSGSEVSLDAATLAALENITVSATDLDIRDLAFATDSVDVSGSSVELGATTLAALENITVSATDLDIRDLAFATDSVDVSGSSVELGATTLAALENISAIVTATDLDIRNLDAAQDNVAIDGISAGGNALVINADGSINVNADISVVNGHEKAEDAAHSSGDIGSYVLAVRQDTLAASTSADGDYSSLKTSSTGALYVNLAESSGTISVSDAALANTAIISAAVTLASADTAQAVASPLADRKYLSIYNVDNNKIFIGGSGVTAANGFPVSPGAYIELRAGAASAVFFVGSSGKTPEIRNLQLS
jgi:hypothetical protein